MSHPMSRQRSARFRSLVGALLLFLLPSAASAVGHEVRILLDLDDDPGTGCLVGTVDGPFDGVEQILITTVETSSPPETGTVTDVATSDCADPMADTFTAPASFDGGWPVGIGNGVSGRDVVETYYPLVASVVDPLETVRLGVVVTDENGGEQALLTTDDSPDGPPILLTLGALIDPAEIPTLGEWGLILLALLLAGLSLRLVGRRGSLAMVAMVALSAAGVAWAAVSLDGLTGEWSAGDQLGSNGIVLFGMVEGDNVCFRVDVDLVFNSGPDAVDDAYGTDEDTVLGIMAPGVLGNDTDPDSDPLTVTDHDPTSAQGAVVTVNADGSFSYDPTGAAALRALDDGESVDDTFSYTASDGSATDTATVTVTVDGVNDAPTAMDDTYETDEDTALVIGAPGVLVNDDDVDGETITAVLDTDVSNGTLMLNADGSFTYTPDLDFNGVDSFTYHANDGTADSGTVTATITVGPVNDGPNAVDDSFTTDEDTVLVEPADGVLMNDTDPEMDPVSVTASDATSTLGAAVSVSADGSFTYDPTGSATLQALDDGEMADDTFTYTIDDGTMNPDTATVTVTVTGVNDAPVANDDGYTTDEDTALNVSAPGVLGNDTDVDVEAPTAVLLGNVSNGTLMLDADGSFTYTPALNFNGVDSFTYRANDGTVSSNLATVTITVNAVNDMPVAADDSVDAVCNLEHVVETDAGQTAADSAPVFRTIVDNVLADDSDPVEMDTVAIVSATGTATDSTGPEYTVTTTEGGTVTLHPDGSFVYTPQGGDRSVADTFTYTIQDAGGAQDTATVTLNVGASCVWFVDNSTGADDTGSGTSSNPFTSLVDELGPDALADDAEDASQAGDVIYVFEGDSRSGDPYDGNFVAEANERILGQGVDLVVDLGGGPETLFTGDPANRPMVEGVSAGVAVSVNDVTGVEVAGLEMTGGDNSFAATSTTAAMGFDLHDNVMAGASTGAIVIDQNGAFDSTAILTGNQVTSSTGAAIQVEVSAGALELALEENTGLTSTGSGIELDGGGGSLYVTSFCGNTVSGDTSGTGIQMMDVIFDADPADMNFTGDEVGCTGTPTSVGSAANPVGGFALSLIDVTGDLAFGTLDLYTDGMDAVGLEVSGPGELNAGAGTGFEITSTGGTISSTDGPAVTIDPATIGLALTTVTSAGSSTTGVSLIDVAGSFSAAGGSISGAAGNAFHIASTLVNDLAVTYGGTITNSSAALVNVTGHPGGTVTFTGNLSATGGTGIQLSNADGSYDFSGTVTLAGGDAGVDIVGGSSGSFTFTDTDVTSPSGIGINVESSDPTSVSFGAASTLTQANNASAVRILNRTGGIFTYSGTINATGGDGLQFNNDDGSQANFNGTVTLDGGDAGIDIVGGSSASFTFSNTTITDPIGAAFAHLNSSSPVTWGTGSISKDNAGFVVDIDGQSGGAINFNGGNFSQDAAAGNGISVVNGTGGSTNFNNTVDLGLTTRLANDAVTIANAAGTTSFADVDVRTNNARGFVQSNASTVTVTTGTVDATGSFAGEGIDVTGGTSNLTFSDVDVTNDGAGGGVSFTSSAGTKTIQALNVTTTTSGTGLFADTAGTLNVTGAANTISATNGTGVSIVDTTIGASDVTLRSVSSSGAANGIVLDSTGASGEFMVTGDGGSTVNGSGGLLTNITGDAIQLTDVQSVSLDQLDMSSVGDHGIDGVRVDGLVVTNSTYNNMGNADTEDVFSFDRDTLGDNGLVGTALFQNLMITNFAERVIDIVNEGTGSLDLDILDVSADNNDDTFGEDAIRVQNEGSVNADVLVSGGTYNNLELDVLAYFAQGTGTNTVEITGVTSTNGGGPDNNPNGGGIAVIGSGPSTTSFDINANNLTGVQGSVIQIIGLATSGQTVTLNGVIGGPLVSDANTFSTDLADGLDLDFDGDGAAGTAIAGTILVQNNTIDFDDDGIGVDHRDAGGTMNVTIRDNVMTAITGDDAVLDADDGIFIFIDDDVGTNTNQLNLEIIDNVVNNLLAGTHVIVVEDVQDGNDVCFAATGNDNGGGNGDIELDTDNAADLVVDATSAANLSTLNNGIGVNEVAAPTYNSAVDCIP
jgi:VCBS repeat-containing protein